MEERRGSVDHIQQVSSHRATQHDGHLRHRDEQLQDDQLLRRNLSFQSLNNYRLDSRPTSPNLTLSLPRRRTTFRSYSNSHSPPLIRSIDPLDSSYHTNGAALLGDPGHHELLAYRGENLKSVSLAPTGSNVSHSTTTATGRASYSSPLDRAVTTYTSVVGYPSKKTTGFMRFLNRIASWLYSISLFIVIVLMLAFIAVTPVDVIAQTFTTNSSIAVKTFIVIIVCVAFVVIFFLIYLVRVYKFKVAMNEVPLKSLYIPFENDFPRDVFKYIDSKLKESHDVAQLAGPLHQCGLINHPGLSPPEYIQKRDAGGSGDMLGKLLPPNMQYEDVLQSFADKFYDGKLLTDADLPIHFSIRDIILYLSEQVSENAKTNEEESSNLCNRLDVDKLIAIYEKCRFSPDLITEKDMFYFMLDFDKFARICQNDYRSKMPKRMLRATRPSHSSTNYDIDENGYISSSDRKYYSSAIFYDTGDEEDEEVPHNYPRGSKYDYDYFDSDTSSMGREHNEHVHRGIHPSHLAVSPLVRQMSPFDHRRPEDQFYTNVDYEQEQSLYNDRYNNDDNEDNDERRSSLRLSRRASVSSSRSVIRNKLALQSKHTLLNLRYDDGENDANSLTRNKSGYITDSENDEFDVNEFGVVDHRGLRKDYKVKKRPNAFEGVPVRIVINDEEPNEDTERHERKHEFEI